MWARIKLWTNWIADHEIWPLAVGVALATFTTRWALWGLGLCVLLWVVRWIGHGRLTVRTPVDGAVPWLAVMVPVTLWATTDRAVTFAAVSRLLAGLTLLYGLVNWGRSSARMTLLVLGLSAVGLGLALVAPVSVGWFTRVKSFLIPSRVYGLVPTLVADTIHPNMMAGALVLLLPFPLAVLILSRPDTLPSVRGVVPQLVARILDATWFRWGLCVASAVLGLAVLLLTKSRGGWMAGSMVVLLILAQRWPNLLWSFFLLPLGVGMLAWQERLVPVLDAIAASGAISGLAGRLEVWSRALYMIQDFPFTGVGAGTFQQVANVLYPFFLAGPDAEIHHAHNLLLQVAVDLGIPGLIAFLAIVMVVGWTAWMCAQYYRQRGQDAPAAVAWAGLVSLAAMLTHGLVDATVWIIGRGAFVPFMVMGTMLALAQVPAWESRGVAIEGTKRRKGDRTRRWAWIAPLIVAGVIGIGLGGWWLLQSDRDVTGQSSIRVPLYPAGEGVTVRHEEPPADAGWVGLLEITTFTTTSSITNVVDFYTGALADSGWQTDMEAGDETSWGGIYTQNGGRSVCLLNVFSVEEDVWVSIVCGDKIEPVDLPSISPLPTPVSPDLQP